MGERAKIRGWGREPKSEKPVTAHIFVVSKMNAQGSPVAISRAKSTLRNGYNQSQL